MNGESINSIKFRYQFYKNIEIEIGNINYVEKIPIIGPTETSEGKKHYFIKAHDRDLVEK